MCYTRTLSSVEYRFCELDGNISRISVHEHHRNTHDANPVSQYMMDIHNLERFELFLHAQNTETPTALTYALSETDADHCPTEEARPGTLMDLLCCLLGYIYATPRSRKGSSVTAQQSFSSLLKLIQQGSLRLELPCTDALGSTCTALSIRKFLIKFN